MENNLLLRQISWIISKRSFKTNRSILKIPTSSKPARNAHAKNGKKLRDPMKFANFRGKNNFPGKFYFPTIWKIKFSQEKKNSRNFFFPMSTPTPYHP